MSIIQEDVEQQNQLADMTVDAYFAADAEQKNATAPSLADLLK